MNKELAKSLLYFVNDVATSEAYLKYASFRIDFLKEQLTSARDFEEIKGLQGAIRELRRFETLRDEVLQFKDN